MPRNTRVDFAGAIHHITTRGNNQQLIFLSDEDKKDFLFILGKVISEFELRCYAYCLMSNHYHLLMESVVENISPAIRKLNGLYSKNFNRRWKRVGHLYQDRFHSELTQTNSHFLEALRYIHLNPVKAGIVSHPKEWLWSSYSAIAGLNQKPIWIDIAHVLELFHPSPNPQEAFSEFVTSALGDSHRNSENR